MNPSKSARLPAAILSASALIFAACRGQPEGPAGGEPSIPPSTPTESQPLDGATLASSPSPEQPEAGLPLPVEQLSGPCEHPFWPLRDGASWIYQMVGGDAPPAEGLTMTVAVTGSGATLTLNGHTGTLNCLDGALSGLPPDPVGHPDLGNALIGLNPRGAYLPDPAILLPPGTEATWDLEAEAGGTITLAVTGNPDPLPVIGGRVVLFSRAGAPEQVSVPAGTFSALPVHQDTFSELVVSLPDGSQQTVLISAGVQRYFVEGLGPVRVVYEGGTISLPGGAWEISAGPVMELVSVTFP